MIRRILSVVLAGMLICGLACFAMGESSENVDTRQDPVEEIGNPEGSEQTDTSEEKVPETQPQEENAEKSPKKPEDSDDSEEKAAPEVETGALAEESAAEIEAGLPVDGMPSGEEGGPAADGTVSGSETGNAFGKENLNPAETDQGAGEKPGVTSADSKATEEEKPENADSDTAPGLLTVVYEYQKEEDGTLVLDENGDPIAILKEGQDIPTAWLRDEAGMLMLDQYGNPIVTETVPASALDISVQGKEGKPAEEQNREEVIENNLTDNEQSEQTEKNMVPEMTEVVIEESEVIPGTIEIIVTEIDDGEIGSSESANENEVDSAAGFPELTEDETEAADATSETGVPGTGEMGAEEDTDTVCKTGADSETDPSAEADGQMAEENAPPKERKAALHSSADGCITAGETIYLTLDLNEFADCKEVNVVWEVNRGEGWVEAGTGEAFAYMATAESLGWQIQARVQYSEG